MAPHSLVRGSRAAIEGERMAEGMFPKFFNSTVYLFVVSFLLIFTLPAF